MYPATFTSVIKNHFLMCLMICAMPFSGSPELSENLFGIAGLKPLNLLSLSVLILWILKGGEILTYTNVVRFRATMLFLLFLLIFSIEFFRTFADYDILQARRPQSFQASSLSFMLSNWLKPVLITTVFLYIINHIKSFQEAEKLIDVILILLVPFALFSLTFSIDIVMSGGTRNMLNEQFNESLGVHYNTVGTIIMVFIPVAMHRALTSSKLWYIVFLILFMAMFFTQSRTAIGSSLVGVLAYFYFIRKIGFGTIGVFALIGGLIWLLGDQVISLFSHGLDSGGLDKVTSGRLDEIWLPLLRELLDRPEKLLLGYGFFGIILSDSYLYTPNFNQAIHSHNAYLDLTMNAGLIVVIPFMYLVLKSFSQAVRFGRLIGNPSYFALLSGIVVYLVAALTGRQFLPDANLMMLFPILALLVVMVIHGYDSYTEVQLSNNDQFE